MHDSLGNLKYSTGKFKIEKDTLHNPTFADELEFALDKGGNINEIFDKYKNEITIEELCCPIRKIFPLLAEAAAKNPQPFMTMWHKFKDQLTIEFLRQQSYRNSKTVLCLLASATIKGQSEPFMLVWERFKNEISLEDLCGKKTYRDCHGETSLWLLAWSARYNPDPLIAVWEKFKNKITTEYLRKNETVPFWTVLFFSARKNSKTLNLLREVLQQTPGEIHLNFKSQCPDSLQRLIDTRISFYSRLNKFNKFTITNTDLLNLFHAAKLATAQGYFGAFYELYRTLISLGKKEEALEAYNLIPLQSSFSFVFSEDDNTIPDLSQQISEQSFNVDHLEEITTPDLLQQITEELLSDEHSEDQSSIPDLSIQMIERSLSDAHSEDESTIPHLLQQITEELLSDEHSEDQSSIPDLSIQMIERSLSDEHSEDESTIPHLLQQITEELLSDEQSEDESSIPDLLRQMIERSLSDDHIEEESTTSYLSQQITEHSSQSEIDLLEQQTNYLPYPKVVSPCATIAGKYFEEGTALPAPLRKKETSKNLLPYSAKCQFYKIKDLKIRQVKARKCFPLIQEGFEADYYTNGNIIQPDDKVLFIRGGRKSEGYIPQSGLVRCIHILTQEEYQEIGSQLPEELDIVVVKRLYSKTHGEFTDLSLLATRRIVPFIIGYYLKTFAIADDNLECLQFNPIVPAENNFDSAYDLMEMRLNNFLAVYVQTDSLKFIRKGELGSKLCLINMQALRRFLPHPRDVFLLFPFADESLHCGGDFYKQLMFFEMCQPYSQGYQILNKADISLKRSSFAKSSCVKKGMRAKIFQPLEGVKRDLSSEPLKWIENARKRLNAIIQESHANHLKGKKHFKNQDLLRVHARANNIEYSQEGLIREIAWGDTFKERLFHEIECAEFLPQELRTYQIAAVKSVAKLEGNLGCINLPTGCGKTYVKAVLAQIAQKCLQAEPGKMVLVVVPKLILLFQLLADFIEFNKKCTTKNGSLQILPQNIITVSCEINSLSIVDLTENETLKRQNPIVLICEKSLGHLLEHHQLFIRQRVSMIIADEYHDYPTSVRGLTSVIAKTDIPLIGTTATQPLNDLLPCLYRYSRADAVAQGYLAPVVADSLGASYSEENLMRLLPCLPAIIKKQYHPGFEDGARLKDTKGIIYLPSIQACIQAQDILESQGLRCFSIHSNNSNYKKDLESFKQSKEPGIALAVFMLGYGFDCKDLGWVLIGRPAEADKHHQKIAIEQICGRVMRKQDDKIGYVLAFEDVLQDVIRPIIEGQIITFPLSTDYLSQKKGYLLENNEQCRVINLIQGNRRLDFKIEPAQCKIMSFRVIQDDANISERISIIRQKWGGNPIQSNSKKM